MARISMPGGSGLRSESGRRLPSMEMAEDLYPWAEIVSATLKEDGRLSALVLRRPQPGLVAHPRAPGSARGVLMNYVFGADGSLLSGACVRNGMERGIPAFEMTLPDTFSKTGSPRYFERCRTSFTCGVGIIGEPPRPDAPGEPLDRNPNCRSREASQRVTQHFPKRVFPVPAGAARVLSLEGRAFHAYPGIAEYRHLLENPPCHEEGRDVWIASEVEQGRADVSELREGDDVSGRGVFLQPGARLVVEVAGVPILFETGAAGAQVVLDPREELAKDWSVLREQLPESVGELEPAIWAPPLAVLGGRLLRIEEGRAAPLCQRFAMVDLCVGACREVRAAFKLYESGAEAFFRDGSAVFSWSSGVKGGRCLEL